MKKIIEIVILITLALALLWLSIFFVRDDHRFFCEMSGGKYKEIWSDQRATVDIGVINTGGVCQSPLIMRIIQK